MHERGWPSRETVLPPGMPESGEYHWRSGGEAHINDPTGIANLQDAVREKNQAAYEAYARNANEQAKAVHLRGLLDFKFESVTPIPIEQVEPWNEIVRRFPPVCHWCDVVWFDFDGGAFHACHRHRPSWREVERG